MKEKKDAKRKMLKELRKNMLSDDSMGLPEMLSKKVKKVTIASDTSEGLEKGLDKAKEIMKKRGKMLGYESEDDDEIGEMEDVKEEKSEIKQRISRLKELLDD